MRILTVSSRSSRRTCGSAAIAPRPVATGHRRRHILREQLCPRFGVTKLPDTEERAELHQCPLVVQRPRLVRRGIRPTSSVATSLTCGRSEPSKNAPDARAATRTLAGTNAADRSFSGEGPAHIDPEES